MSVRAETPEQWITLGARVHGAFGSFIPVGIRIGLDALKRLDAKPRGVTVVYYSGPKSPCPCPADGIAIATQASVGQGTLQVCAGKGAGRRHGRGGDPQQSDRRRLQIHHPRVVDCQTR